MGESLHQVLQNTLQSHVYLMKTMTQIQFGICFFAQFKSADKIGFKFICSLCEHTVRADEKMESGQLILDGVKLVELNQTQ